MFDQFFTSMRDELRELVVYSRRNLDNAKDHASSGENEAREHMKEKMNDQ